MAGAAVIEKTGARLGIERQEIHCHNCDRYVQFDIDTGLNGRHVLNCPVCGHEHCRIVRDGKITDERWDQRNANMQFMPTYSATNATTSATSVSYAIYSGSTSATTPYTSDLWLQTVQP